MSPRESAAPVAAAAAATAQGGLLAKLMAAVRPEFRGDVLAFGPYDPVFGNRPCLVPDCPLTGRSHGLCVGHENRWRSQGRPDLEPFAASTDPRMRRRRALSACRVPGCHNGQHAGGLCRGHDHAWRRGGRPQPVDVWLATLPAWVHPDPPPLCLISYCQLWAEPDMPLCAPHRLSRKRSGPQDLEQFVRAHDDPPLPGYESIDLRALPARLRLEMQYSLQQRRDVGQNRIAPAAVQVVVSFLAGSEATSLLDKTLQEWTSTWDQHYGPRQGSYLRSLLISAHRDVEDLHLGSGWDVEYPRDVWRLASLGIGEGRPTLRFDRVTQPWLKDLAKRWLRWRLSSGLSTGSALGAVLAISRFSRFLTTSDLPVDSFAQVDRALLERFLAALHTELGGRQTQRETIGQLNTFLQAIRRHGWDQHLPANTVFLREDYPKRGQLMPRALAELVMTQLENADNLRRWDNPVWRLVTIILIRSGLRLKDALRLPADCIIRDRDGAPYLRYHNHKMKREALVPIDEQVEAEIAEQRQRVRDGWPQGSPLLFPAAKANRAGTKPVSIGGYRGALRSWLKRCDVRDEHGQPIHLTPHQWRHTFGTRLINKDVPQEVVRILLDHQSHAMTAHYARLSDTTVRRHWEQARKVDINGDTVTLDPGGQLAEAAWAKQRLGRATQALPNGYCGLPIQKTCPHANACLTCPMFITTAEFLPQHRQQHQQILHIITTAQAHNQTRVAQMNRDVADNLEKIINALEQGPPATSGGSRCVLTTPTG